LPWQFSLRAALLCLLGISFVLALASQFPRQTAFVVSMTLLLLCPLIVLQLLLGPFVSLGMLQVSQSTLKPGFVRLLVGQLRVLRAPETGPSLLAGGTIALVSTLTLVASWPLLREMGCAMSLLATQPIPNHTYSANDALRSITDTLPSAEYWLRLWQWELWSVGRWWLLFSTLTIAWIVISLAIRRSDIKAAGATVARLLAFAPWFIVLEVLFLIGVWIQSPNTVPEPSTGFVVGIFSWKLWHWDCWLNSGWLIRGALPSYIAGVVFFSTVLRFPSPASLVVSLLLIPIALLLSVAWTVAYRTGFPPFF
jgi:hypothetical protein